MDIFEVVVGLALYSLTHSLQWPSATSERASGACETAGRWTEALSILEECLEDSSQLNDCWMSDMKTLNLCLEH